MKLPHRASVENLQAWALGTANRIDEATAKLGAEIVANTTVDPNFKKRFAFFGGDGKRKPETVTYKTADVERLMIYLQEAQLELRWWATPVELRTKLTKPFSQRK